MIVRRLIIPLALAIVSVQAGPVLAQGSFPAPLPNQVQRNDPAFPPVNGAAPSASFGASAPRDTSFPVNGAAPIEGAAPAGPAGPPQGGAAAQDCMKAFMPLREDAEKKGKLIKVASDRHAPPAEACKLIGNFASSEIRMIDYVESHSKKCGIPAQVGDQLKVGHQNTEKLLKKVCAIAEQVANRAPAGPSLSDILGSSTAVPEASQTKKGGSTFDTMNGNVLQR